MPRRKRLTESLRAALLSSAFLVVYQAGSAVAQPPAVTVQPRPQLPDTQVEAQPQVQPTPVQDYYGEPFPFGSVLDGGIFANPPAYGYRAETSTTGSIIAIPDYELPFTVNSITRDILDDQIALRVSDVFRNAGGVNLLGDSQFADRLLLRGQQVSSGNYRKDGFLDRTQVPRDFQNVERIEILKGPASVLYGAGDAAGLINVITKKAVNDRFANVGYTFGSFGQDRFTLDANNVSQSGNVFYRLNVAQEDSQSFVDYDFLSRTQIAPVVTWMMSDSTSLTWNGEYHRDHRIGYQGVPAIHGNPLALPPSRYAGQPANDFVYGEEFRQSLVLRHQLSDDWYFSIGGYSLFTETPQSTTAASTFAPIIPDPVQPNFNQFRSNNPYNDEQTHSMIANLGGEFDTGNFHHTALVGMEYAYLDSQSFFSAELPISGFFMGFPIPASFNAANPVYTNPATIPLFGLQTNAFRQQRVGGYIQDLVEINEYWSALAGVRFDTVDFTFNRSVFFAPNPIPPADITEQTFNRTSPRGGLVFKPFADDTLSLYYSYSQSFSPPGGGAYFTAGGLNPVLGESHEAGVKTELVDGLSLTAAGFYTSRQNDTFFLNPGPLFQVGEVTSQGAELNLLGTITDDWSILANYCYVDSKVYDTTLGLDGTPNRNVPHNTANLWSRYNVYNDGYKTVGAALGIVYVGERSATLTPTGIDLPGFTRWDAGLYYRQGRFNTAVYIENIFDVQYAASSANEYQIFMGAPVNARATVSYTF